MLIMLLSGCAPGTLKTVELKPLLVTTGTSVVSGSFGFCDKEGVTPVSTFSSAPPTVMVGYDDFFKGGKVPFACDDVRVSTFKGGVKFDVSQFDSITNAELLLDTIRSVSRDDGRLIATEVPISYANKLCMSTEIYASPMLCDNHTRLPVGETIKVRVSEQVGDWVTMSRNNFGFVLKGPRPEFSIQTPPRDNNAKVSWYSNFRLRVTYQPALNSRAPQ